MEPTFEQKLNTLTIIYFSQVMILIAFSGIVLYLNLTDPVGSPEDYSPIISYVPFILLIVCFPASNFVFRTYLRSNTRDDMDIDQKFGLYQTGTIIRGSILEIAGLFATVIAFLTGQSELLIITGFVILLFYITRPTPFKINQSVNIPMDKMR